MKRNFSRYQSALVLALLLLLGISASAQAFFWNDYKKDTLTYTPAGWPARLDGDLFLPKDKKKGPYPTMLLLHGGAWHKGDRKSMAKVGKILADHGFAAFSIDYRLAPQFHYPAQLQDMQQALRWLQQNAGKYHLDMNHVGVWGYSAGANLAALLGVQPLTTDIPSVRVVIAGGTPTDLRAAKSSSVAQYIGASESQAPELYQQASPITQVHPGLPAFFLYHGSADELVAPKQAEAFAQALKDADVPVRLVEIAGEDHRGTATAAIKILPEALSFLDEHIRK